MKITESLKTVACLIFATLGLILGSAGAYASLIITLSGTPGLGITTAMFTGSSTTAGDGVINADTFTGFDGGDTFNVGQGPLPLDPIAWILDPTIDDLIAPFLSGSTVAMSIGGSVFDLTALLFDDDSAFNDTNDLGVRAASAQSYLAGEAVTWTGSADIALDYSVFLPGTYLSTFAAPESLPLFANDPVTLIIETPNLVPLPASLPLVTVGLGSLAVLRRRRGRRYCRYVTSSLNQP